MTKTRLVQGRRYEATYELANGHQITETIQVVRADLGGVLAQTVRNGRTYQVYISYRDLISANAEDIAARFGK